MLARQPCLVKRAGADSCYLFRRHLRPSREEWGKIAAGGTMVMLPVVLFSLLVRKYLVRGLTAGAVKG
jgi:multiple sugar transport system permease protein